MLIFYARSGSSLVMFFISGGLQFNIGSRMSLTSIKDKLFSEQTKSTLKWIAAGAAIFGIAFLGKKLFGKLTTKTSNQQQTQSEQKTKQERKTPERLNTKVTEYSQFYFDKDLELQYIQSNLSENPTVEDIYLNSPLIARDQFIKYTREIRKRRRLIRKTNEDQYINVILTYQAEIQELLLRSRSQLLEYLNMDPQIFQNMQQNYQAIQDLRALNRKSQQLLKNKLITQTKPRLISDQKLQQIIQQQLHFIHNRMYDRLRQKLQKELNINQNQILMVVESLLEDIIYERFGYQMEDVVRKMQEIGCNARELNQARRKMEIDIGDFNFDSVESLEDPQSEYSDMENDRNMKRSVKTVEKSQSITSQP